MSVSIKEIAKHTGLSIPTVGNVLGRSASRYSAETRRRVAEAVRELGYRPNSSARAMRQGRFGCAALVLSRSHQQTHSYIPPRLLDGLDDELSLHNMHLTVSRLTDEESEGWTMNVLTGCGELGIFFRVMLPLSKPALVVVALFAFLGVWNDFLGPLVFLLRSEQFTLGLGLQTYQSQHGGTPWHLLMAASVLVIAPIIILFFVAQKAFVQGISTTGMKG